MADTKLCGKPAAFRYTWPGRDEAHICADCQPRLMAVVYAMGFHLQILPVEVGSTQTCTQHVKVQS